MIDTTTITIIIQEMNYQFEYCTLYFRILTRGQLILCNSLCNVFINTIHLAKYGNI